MSAATAQEAPAATDPVVQIFTQREQVMIVHALISMKSPAVDYVKVAERMGLKNPRSVSNAWSLIKKKIQTFDKEERKRKGLPSEDEAEDDAETVKKSPKRARATKAAGTPKSAKVAKTGKASTPRTPRAKKSDLFVAAEDLAGDDEEDELKMEVKTEVKAEAMVKAEDMVKAEPEAEDADTI